MKYAIAGFLLFIWVMIARIMWLLTKNKSVPVIEVVVEILGGPLDGEVFNAKLGVGEKYSLIDKSGSFIDFGRAPTLDNAVHVSIRSI